MKYVPPFSYSGIEASKNMMKYPDREEYGQGKSVKKQLKYVSFHFIFTKIVFSFELL